MFRGAHRVVQFVGDAALMQVFELREERRYADAAGDQHVLAGDLVQGEQVHRVRNLQPAPQFDGVVHEMRTTARFLHAPHPDLVGIELRRRAQQRVGVLVHAVRALHDDDDVRAPREHRQAAAADRRQLEMLDLRRHLFDADDFDRDGLRVVHRKTSLSGGSSPGASASAMTPM